MTFASPVFAADMPLKAPAPVLVAPSWTGWYIGADVGGKWVTDDWNTTCVQLGGAITCGTPRNNAVFPGAPDATAAHSFETSGVRAGVYAGAMFQVNPSWVFGIEGDYGFYDQSSTVTGVLGCSIPGCRVGRLGSTPASDSTGVTNKDDFSLRLRGGFLVTPDILVYGTGGVAFQRVEATVTCERSTSPVCSGTAATFSQTDAHWMPGWTIGGGVEWKFLTNWLIRGEYRYSDFGTFKPSPDFFVGTGNGAAGPGAQILADLKVKSQIATVGLAYMFPIPK
jgi:outer membrane immunogenic protein